MGVRKNKLRWIPCPICGGRTRNRIYTDTVPVNFPLYCRKCKDESI